MQSEADKTLETLWKEAVGTLQLRLEREEFDSWIRPLVPVAISEKTVELAVPNRLFASWLEENYLELLTAAWVETSGRRSEFTFTWNGGAIQGELFRDLQESQSETRLEAAPAKRPGGLVGRYDFDSFVVGPSNQFAHAASMAVCNQPGTLYNPFFLYGGVGLGKTHLANAIGNSIVEKNPKSRVLFLSSDGFTNELIEAIARNKTLAFKNRMRRVDVLIVDDIQFLAGRERTQEEFFHVFNALYDQERQIILTSDKFPNEMEGVAERLCNRFGWGLVADIQSPDVETRAAILECKARSENLELPRDVAAFIAEKIDSNIRDLEGALTRVSAYASLNRRCITRELAEELLDGVSPNGTHPPTLEDVERGVSSHFGLEVGELKARRRTKKVAEARQIAMYIMRHHTGSSYPAIGEHLGGRDHSTVIHACQAVDRRCRHDPRYRHMIETVSRMIGCG